MNMVSFEHCIDIAVGSSFKR